MRILRLLPLLFVSIAGCSGDTRPGGDGAEPGTNAAPAAPVAGTWTDSAERAAQLTAFREGLSRPTSLETGAGSAAALVETFVRAVEARDTSAFAPMMITRAEFAWLHYPGHPLALPPYDLSPQEMWFQQVGNSEKGLREVLEKRGGRPLGYLGFRCDPPVPQGGLTFHGNCVIERRTDAGAVVRERLFGALVERDGRWKFASYSARL